MCYNFKGVGSDVKTASDLMKNGPTFTAHGTAAVTASTGYGGGGGAEIGEAGHLEAPSHPLFQFTEEFAIGFIMKSRDISSEKVLIEQYDPRNDKAGWTITMLHGGKIRIDGRASVGITVPESYQPGHSKPDTIRSARYARPGNWHKVLVMHRRSAAKKSHFDTLIWVDGVLSAIRPQEDDQFAVTGSSVLIGKGIRRHPSGTMPNKNKNIISSGLSFDELWVWHNRALNDQEVKDWFKEVEKRADKPTRP